MQKPGEDTGVSGTDLILQKYIDKMEQEDRALNVPKTVGALKAMWNEMNNGAHAARIASMKARHAVTVTLQSGLEKFEGHLRPDSALSQQPDETPLPGWAVYDARCMLQSLRWDEESETANTAEIAQKQVSTPAQSWLRRAAALFV